LEALAYPFLVILLSLENPPLHGAYLFSHPSSVIPPFEFFYLVLVGLQRNQAHPFYAHPPSSLVVCSFLEALPSYLDPLFSKFLPLWDLFLMVHPYEDA
jgi:hypothetical protein